MRHHLRLWHITFTVLLMLQVSCATTTITKAWKDDSFQALPVKNIYVVGLVPNPSVRKTFEDEFVKQLSARGLQATVSYSAIPFEKAADKSVLAAQIRAAGADTLLITRFIKREMVTTYIPGTVSALPYDYYYNLAGLCGVHDRTRPERSRGREG